MTLNDIKDALENSGTITVAEKKIPHGIQLVLKGSTYVNVYDTGSYVVQGNNSQGVRKAIESWISLIESTPPAGASKPPARESWIKHPNAVTVNNLKPVLNGAGYTVLKEIRLQNGSGTQLKLWGRQTLTIYENGKYDLRGPDAARIHALINKLVLDRLPARKVRPWVW